MKYFFQSYFLALLVLVLNRQLASGQLCNNYYTIFSGDTCDNIAGAYRITTAYLQTLNPTINCLSLVPGTRICVPAVGSGAININTLPCTSYYTVFSGDSCDNIAAAYRITTSTLLLLNSGLNCQNLLAGTRLCVSSSSGSTIINTVTCSNYYTIFSGDSCDNIAAAFRISTAYLLTLNPTLNCAALIPGTRICVPLVAPTTTTTTVINTVTCSNYYTIFSGDTCDNIAAAYRITTSYLISLNPTINCANLVAGLRICVPFGSTTTVINPVACSNYYTIFSGDTCDNIAAAYRITTAYLLSLNPT